MNREEENWKDIKGYEGLYQVSDRGRIKTLANDKYRKEKIRKPRKGGKGYMMISLTKERITKHKQVHRLVAEAFIPNPDNLPQVNHKDEDPTNNNVENLEWCTLNYNLNYGTRMKKVVEKLSRQTAQYSPDGKLIKVWPSLREIQRETGYCQSSISMCCNGKYKQAYGFIWTYQISSQFP